MITFVRTVVAQPGKLFELIEAMQKSVPIFNRVTGATVKIATTFGSDAMQIALIANFESVAQVQEAGAKAASDAEWRAVSAAAHALSVPGSIRDHIWTHI